MFERSQAGQFIEKARVETCPRMNGGRRRRAAATNVPQQKDSIDSCSARTSPPYLAGLAPEALEAINEAEALAERIEQRSSLSRLHRLRGVFLAAIGAEETQMPEFGSFVRNGGKIIEQSMLNS
jgi:hypothetical protein